jgi:hypothetical protein
MNEESGEIEIKDLKEQHQGPLGDLDEWIATNRASLFD